MVWPAVIAAAGAVAGGAMNANSARNAAEQNRRMNADNVAYQREFAQMGVRWRVADARAAGLHPMYALGASLPSFSPAMIPAQADTSMGDAIAQAGQNLGRAAAAGSDSIERQLQLAQLRVLNAQADKDFALGQAALSEARRREDENLASMPFPAYSHAVQMPGATVSRDLGPLPELQRSSGAGSNDFVTVKPNEVTRADPGAPQKPVGVDPFWQEYEMAPGFRMLMPRSDNPGEVLENVSIWQWPVILKQNQKYFGKDWLNRFWTEFVLGRGDFRGGGASW